MSCFTIERKEYERAAGFIVGMTETQSRRFSGSKAMDVYDAEAGRRLEPEDIRADFVELHRINASAVSRRYREDFGEFERDACDAEYKEGVHVAKALMTNGYLFGMPGSKQRLETCIFGLIHFLSSAIYQIDDTENLARAMKILGKYYRAICEFFEDGTSSRDLATWGEFNPMRIIEASDKDTKKIADDE